LDHASEGFAVVVKKERFEKQVGIGWVRDGKVGQFDLQQFFGIETFFVGRGEGVLFAFRGGVIAGGWGAAAADDGRFLLAVEKFDPF
jgi:hypothetical protein